MSARRAPDASHPAMRVSHGHASRHLVRATFDLARTLGIRKLLVKAKGRRDVDLVERQRQDEQVIWLNSGGDELSAALPAHHVVLTIPENAALTRMSQMSVALFLSVLNGHVDVAESVLCLSGVAGSGWLDTLWIANPKREFVWFARERVEVDPHGVPIPEVARLIEIALRFAAEGREGKPIGTIFVIGDADELAPFLRQLVLNPCLGHPREARSIFNPELLETLREYAAMDGAFIVSPAGTVEAAATFLAAPLGRIRLRMGLGARRRPRPSRPRPGPWPSSCPSPRAGSRRSIAEPRSSSWTSAPAPRRASSISYTLRRSCLRSVPLRCLGGTAFAVARIRTHFWQRAYHRSKAAATARPAMLGMLPTRHMSRFDVLGYHHGAAREDDGRSR